MTDLLAYKGEETKRSLLKRLRHHRELDQIIQGSYWTGNGEGRGCAVGCATHNPTGGHDEFPRRWGVPVQVAYLIDHIFESLPIDEAKEWPVRVMSAPREGADLSRVYDQWCAWMLRRLVSKAAIANVVLDPSVEVMASLFERVGAGDEPSDTEWSEAAGAAWAAWAAEAAGAAWAAGAARAAEAAGAAGAAGAARAAEAAGAAWAAWAARAAEAAEAARARHEWARAAADELVRLLKAAA